MSVMDNSLTLMLSTSIFTALVTALLFLVFVWLRPSKSKPEIKKLKKCSACGKWSDVS